MKIEGKRMKANHLVRSKGCYADDRHGRNDGSRLLVRACETNAPDNLIGILSLRSCGVLDKSQSLPTIRTDTQVGQDKVYWM